MINHPGPINMKEWKTIAVPTRWNLADEDDFMQNDQIGRLVQLSRENTGNGLAMEYEVYPGKSLCLMHGVRCS